MKTVEQFWQEYKRAVITDAADLAQIIESKRAFFAGFESMIQAMDQDDEQLSTPDGLAAYMMKLEQEINLFASQQVYH
jgi:hypothetical protein